MRSYVKGSYNQQIDCCPYTFALVRMEVCDFKSILEKHLIYIIR